MITNNEREFLIRAAHAGSRVAIGALDEEAWRIRDAIKASRESVLPKGSNKPVAPVSPIQRAKGRKQLPTGLPRRSMKAARPRS